jgi:hypothetical protein
MISTPAHFSVVSYYMSFAADFANAFLDDRSGGAMQTLIKVGDNVGHFTGSTKMAVAAIKMPGVPHCVAEARLQSCQDYPPILDRHARRCIAVPELCLGPGRI